MCLLEGLGIRHAVVGALSAMEANDPKEELAVRAVEHGEVLHAESPRHTPMKHRLPHRGLQHAHLQRERICVHIIQLQLEWIEACPRKSDPSFDLWHNVGGLVGKATQALKLRCLFVPLGCCFDDERRGKGCLVCCPQQHGFRLL